jgi:hypothetical protein
MVEWSPVEKLTVELSFISLAGFQYTDPPRIAGAVTELLARMLPRQEIVWGPAVHQPPREKWGGAAKPSDALVFICRDSDSGEYSVVFRGTNPISTMEWLSQDFLVKKQVPWRLIQAGPAPEDALVSEGTAAAVALRRDLRPAQGAKGEGQSLGEAIFGILERSDGSCVMRFTGHSLGGLLAPVMALWLLDYLADRGREDIEAKLSLEVYGYAAPTAGNGVFAAYLESRISANAGLASGRVRRYASDLDIAPCAWDESTLMILPSLYEPEIDMQPLTWSLYDLCRKLAKGKGYAQPGERVAVPSMVVPTRGGIYFLEAAYQHSVPYLDILDPDRKETILREVIEPLSSLVSVKGLKPVDLRDLFYAGR